MDWLRLRIEKNDRLAFPIGTIWPFTAVVISETLYHRSVGSDEPESLTAIAELTLKLSKDDRFGPISGFKSSTVRNKNSM